MKEFVDDVDHTELKQGWVVATCEICSKRWKIQKSLVTRTCSKVCGAKINPASSIDESKWSVVNCTCCSIEIRKRTIHVNKRNFCSRSCVSKGFAQLHQEHDVKVNKAKGTKRGLYQTINGRIMKYDSSYELRRMREYDYLLKESLESWNRSTLAIPYTDIEGKLHHCNPDFELRYTNGDIVLEEVKGQLTENELRKFDAITEYATQHGMKAKLFSLDDFQNRLEVKTKVYENDYGTFSRPTLEYVVMSMAIGLAARSTCLRKKVGVVFTDLQMQRAHCFGYNGDEAGGKNQCESLKPGQCNCIHAEINALTKNNVDITDSICFLTLSPCNVCAKVLINRRIKRVIYLEAYRNNHGIRLLQERGVEVVKYDCLIDSSSDVL